MTAADRYANALHFGDGRPAEFRESAIYVLTPTA